MAEDNIYTYLTMMNRAVLLSTENVVNYISYIVSNHKKGRILDTDTFLKLFDFKCKDHCLDSFHLDPNIFKEATEIYSRIYEMKQLVEELEYIR